MAQSSKIGTFLTGTGVATTQVAVTGVGFTPKCVIMWWNGLNGAGNILQRNDLRGGVGFAVSSSDRRNVGGQSDDGVGTSSTDGQMGDESCVRVLNTSGALAGALDVVTMDADGFTLVVDTQFAVDLRVSYWAIGGSDITNVKTGLVEEPAATGSQATTGLGFQPDVMLFMTAVQISGIPTQGATWVSTIGFAVPTFQAATMWRDQDALASTNASSWGASTLAVTGRIVFNSGPLAARATLTSFDADGFTLNWLTRAFTGVDYYYLAIKGGSWAAGELLTQTDITTPIAVTGPGFTPSAVWFMSAGAVEQGDTSSDPPAILSLGAATSASNRLCTYMLSENVAGVCIAGQRTDAVYQAAENTNTTATQQGLMDVQSFDAGGFTCIMDDAETAQMWVAYLAAGGGAASSALARTSIRGLIG